MTESPELALQKAVVAALEAAPAFVALVGRGAIYDRLIDRADFPYVVLAEMTTLDWSTQTEPGTEHVFTIEVWSKAAGKREVEEIAAVIRTVLHDQALALDVGALINLRCEKLRAERLAKQRLYRATLRLRAVIET